MPRPARSRRRPSCGRCRRRPKIPVVPPAKKPRVVVIHLRSTHAANRTVASAPKAKHESEHEDDRNDDHGEDD